MDKDEQEFLDASLVGARSLANRHNQKVTVVHNTFKHRLQPFFITMADNEVIKSVNYTRPYLYILPDRHRCPVVIKARKEWSRRNTVGFIGDE